MLEGLVCRELYPEDAKNPAWGILPCGSIHHRTIFYPTSASTSRGGVWELCKSMAKPRKRVSTDIVALLHIYLPSLGQPVEIDARVTNYG